MAELIDKVRDSQVTQYTCHHLFEEDTIYFERTYGHGYEGSRSHVIGPALPQHIKVFAHEPGLISYTKLEKQNLKPPAPGWVPVVDLLQLAGRNDLFLRSNSLRRILHIRAGIECRLGEGNRPVFFAPPEAVAFFRHFKIPGRAPEGWQTARTAEPALGFSAHRIQAAAHKLKITGELFRGRNNLEGSYYYSPAELAQIREYLAQQIPQADNEYTLNELCRLVGGASRPGLSSFLASRGHVPVPRMTFNGPETSCYTKEALAAAYEYK